MPLPYKLTVKSRNGVEKNKQKKKMERSFLKVIRVFEASTTGLWEPRLQATLEDMVRAIEAWDDAGEGRGG